MVLRNFSILQIEPPYIVTIPQPFSKEKKKKVKIPINVTICANSSVRTKRKKPNDVTAPTFHKAN